MERVIEGRAKRIKIKKSTSMEPTDGKITNKIIFIEFITCITLCALHPFFKGIHKSVTVYFNFFSICQIEFLGNFGSAKLLIYFHPKRTSIFSPEFIE